ncbi:hypothetical protein BGZ61DRAFT_498225 [Ilyonectria robusta]|uniref:uncharacterized protein n=1 Tax=Ilyonectria robusta TaxID=1079257 RepID=UPI001E8D8FF2|nr:uncharacterized protein BGZ61DRAFT_498225 [Ilyonectria robusta]KAH8667710.1 hypothetical protein BGZ61DRAFT_498225 [Ilyonectria robusta]
MLALKTSSRLAGKVAIVTGGGSGYGEGITKRFAQEGAKVLIADINERGGKTVSQHMPNSISFIRADVAVEGDWHKLIEAAKSRYGRLDCLVNNAGTTYSNKPTVNVTERDFDKCFNVNVKGVFFGASAFIPELIKQGQGGTVVNIASVGATRPRPGLVWYNASKGAVCNATKGLAAEYGPHQIRVNSVCPLLGGTGLFEAFCGEPDTPENRAKFTSNVPLQRLCEPEDVANACLFLASDESQFITGINLEVDVGFKATYKKCVLKPQILKGGRANGIFDNGLKGGIQVAETAVAGQEIAAKMFGQWLKTKQTTTDGIKVNQIYVAESIEHDDEWYLALTLDRENYTPVVIVSKKGGVDIETLANENPDELHSFKFSLTSGITAELVSRISECLKLPPKEMESLRKTLTGLYNLFVAKDATLLEINPLARSSNGMFTCLDAKFTFDTAAEKRQKELFALRDREKEVEEELEAEKHGLIYIKMDGNIGNVVNGAGLAMATNDAIFDHGGTSANFLDAGGQATKETMQKAFEIILRDERVKTILVNVYGGIIRCDMIAESIIGAATALGPLRVPLAVRLQGTNSAEGLKLIKDADLGLHVESDFGKAAAKAVELAGR